MKLRFSIPPCSHSLGFYVCTAPEVVTLLVKLFRDRSMQLGVFNVPLSVFLAYEALLQN